MPITLVVNGYFRSGSTMIFRLLRESNPDKSVLYEPFHPNLFNWLIGYKRGKISTLHKTALWDEYLNLKNFRKIRTKHIQQFYCYDFNSWIDYIDTIHSEKKDIVLQPNRAHFIIKDLNKRYKSRIIHLIRNPIDSLVSSGLLSEGKTDYSRKEPKSFIEKLDNSMESLKIFLKVKNLNDFFYLIKYYFERITTPWFCSHFMFKETYEKFVKDKLIKDIARDNIDKYLMVWTEINYSAKTQIESLAKQGLIVYYENLVNNPEKELKKIAKFADVKMDGSKNKIHKKSVRKYRKETREDINNRITKLNIEEKVRYILGKEIYNQTFRK